MKALRHLARAALRASRPLYRPRTPTPGELAHIRSQMGLQVLDCERGAARRARAQLEASASAQQLWLLRSEIFQVVTHRFGQSEAERRVATLTPLFDGLLPRANRQPPAPR